MKKAPYGEGVIGGRGQALQEIARRRQPRVSSGKNISDYFGEHVLTLEKMREHLPSEDVEVMEAALRSDNEAIKIDDRTADSVAKVVREWAMYKGASHYTHWFQPLTGSTAEKHDIFFNSRKGIEELKSGALTRQEPDASSFPSGGIRSTFEARGYTAWDPSSPFFVWGDTLCIPTVFISYTGESLDYKAPLLRSVRALRGVATDICQRFYSDVTEVTPMLGWEQEYFVIDKAWYTVRPDLVMTGRTLLGQAPARGQQLADHYFGVIPPRVLLFMQDVERQAHGLGIPLITRHNEVAPSQFEFAPMFEPMNIAVDHNQMLREIMRKIAGKHHLHVLFHEKPFHGLNGNGKHCNWSLATDTGINLMQSSKDPKQDLLFFTFFVNVLRAVKEHAALLSASVATYGNDFRLGGHEAPPSIFSAFVGVHLMEVLKNFIKTQKLIPGEPIAYMQHGIREVPDIEKDDTDRNRTSPFAFTGNKFEFRAPGAGLNPASACLVLNAIVSSQLKKFAQETKSMKVDSDEYKKVLARHAKEAMPVVFNGDGYAQAWLEEAEKRQLTRVKNTPEALQVYEKEKEMKPFKEGDIFSEKEIRARKNIRAEDYVYKAQIESNLLSEMVLTQVLPASVKHLNQLMQSVGQSEALGVEAKSMKKRVQDVSKKIESLQQEVGAMQSTLRQIDQLKDTQEKASHYAEKVREGHFHRIRALSDGLEMEVEDDLWPLAKYREMLFLR